MARTMQTAPENTGAPPPTPPSATSSSAQSSPQISPVYRPPRQHNNRGKEARKIRQQQLASLAAEDPSAFSRMVWQRQLAPEDVIAVRQIAGDYQARSFTQQSVSGFYYD
jgi:hypothetical protein